jgi:hypothetical protein
VKGDTALAFVCDFADFGAWSGGRKGRLPRHIEGEQKMPEKLLTLLALILEILKLLLEYHLDQ